MNIKVGMKLIPKPDMRDWDDSFAEVYAQDGEKFMVIVDDNFSAWLTVEEIEKEFDEVEEQNQGELERP